MGWPTLVLKISHQRQHQYTHLPLSEKIQRLLLQAAIPQPRNPPPFSLVFHTVLIQANVPLTLVGDWYTSRSFNIWPTYVL